MKIKLNKMAANDETELREKLLRTVKKEVKQIMEEAVTRKFVHEESSSITSLCAAVDNCLSFGLKRRALGLFRTNSTTALLQKVAKTFEPAAHIIRLVAEIEYNSDPSGKSASIENVNKSKQGSQQGKKPPGPTNPKYLWIRVALFEKVLAKIIDYLVQNSSKYYEKDSLVADPVDGPILASLLVGPCALDYSKMKTPDHYWTDPPADELVQRHKIHSGLHLNGQGSPKRPSLQVGQIVKRNPSGSGNDDSYRSIPLSARDYVESLHQNSKATLLYGKNNVLVQPKEDIGAIPGYLSLHQTTEGLTIKWTPNQLMNSCSDDSIDGSQEHSIIRNSLEQQKSESKSATVIYWDYALTVNLDDIVYLHCHQQADTGGTIVLVGQDGVQRPPIHFPKGGHLLSFLSCLENGLLPHGQLDPPLWSQRGKGKVFPRLKRKGTRLQSKKESEEGNEDDEDGASDYVFRIITALRPELLPQEILDPKATIKSGMFPWPHSRESSTKGPLTANISRHTHIKTISVDEFPEKINDAIVRTSPSRSESMGAPASDSAENLITLKSLCDTMKKQIISRAFYGWLAHCRHLRTVRTHLSGLLYTTIVSIEDPVDASKGLTVEVWAKIHHDGKISDEMEVYRLVYFGGVEHEIRKEVWPYLLGHYKFGSTEHERQNLDEHMRTSYETTMSEWLAVEAIVRQRDKEIMAANLAKLSSESNNGEIPLLGKDSSLSNEVFEDTSSIGSVDHPDWDNEPLIVEDLKDDDPTPKPSTTDHEEITNQTEENKSSLNKKMESPDEGLGDSYDTCISEGKEIDNSQLDPSHIEIDTSQNIVVTNTSIDSGNHEVEVNEVLSIHPQTEEKDESELNPVMEGLTIADIVDGTSQLSAESRSTCMSPASSGGGVYSLELLDSFALNLHRIDKDVQRCDRNYWYFTTANLEKLRNVMCTYVWERLEIGYVQGMCDLVAPLLVIFDDEAKTYSCFCELMKRMSANFPHGGAMDSHFANMRSLIQILDPEMFELMHQNGDYTHFYFCYRWFLLDFKRELLYDDVFSVWETIWAAKNVASSQFVLFIALALVEYYREIILDNNMDFTDIIKFFNEMAERHNAKAVLKIARDLVHKLQTLIDNK